MRAKLKAIASVQMGHSFRSRLEQDFNGNVSVIQMKDLTDDNRLDDRNLARVKLNDLKERHWVKRNDLVFRSRGQTNTVALIDKEVDQAVVAAPLLRIRVESQQVLPEYLCWFINQPVSQTFLQSQATGSAMRMIGKQVLEELEIKIPSIGRQHRIIDLSQLANEEQYLLILLSAKRKQLIDYQLSMIIE
jgi:restriction endonuclease S subunit